MLKRYSHNILFIFLMLYFTSALAINTKKILWILKDGIVVEDNKLLRLYRSGELLPNGEKLIQISPDGAMLLVNNKYVFVAARSKFKPRKNL